MRWRQEHALWSAAIKARLMPDALRRGLQAYATVRKVGEGEKSAFDV